MFAFFKKLFARADVNKDGKVDVQDAKVAVESIKTQATATKMRAVAKKTAAKKPASKKPTAKKFVKE
jgi:hypothetical protein